MAFDWSSAISGGYKQAQGDSKNWMNPGNSGPERGIGQRPGLNAQSEDDPRAKAAGRDLGKGRTVSDDGKTITDDKGVEHANNVYQTMQTPGRGRHDQFSQTGSPVQPPKQVTGGLEFQKRQVGSTGTAKRKPARGGLGAMAMAAKKKQKAGQPNVGTSNIRYR